MNTVVIDSTWKEALKNEFSKAYWQELTEKVRSHYIKDVVYPPAKEVFRAFNLCPIDSVKVVIVGQDPYHGPKQANGLSFAVGEGIPLPPSLQNIFKEIKNDLGIIPHASGDLTRWASQGVFLLNSVLTVLGGRPASHAGIGWETFTDAVIQTLNEKRTSIVYMLWGKYAQTKGAVINREKNLVLISAHPSPYSVSMFYGKHHFSQCNAYLEAHGNKAIDWR